MDMDMPAHDNISLSSPFYLGLFFTASCFLPHTTFPSLYHRYSWDNACLRSFTAFAGRLFGPHTPAYKHHHLPLRLDCNLAPPTRPQGRCGKNGAPHAPPLHAATKHGLPARTCLFLVLACAYLQNTAGDRDACAASRRVAVAAHIPRRAFTYHA